MNIERIFSTKERIAVLKGVIFLEKPFGVNEIAKKIGLSKGLISKYLEILEQEGVLRREKGKFIVENNSNVKSIKIMLNIQRIDSKIFKKYPFVKAVGLYGSCAKGTNTESSDIDMWIKITKAKDKELAKLTSELKEELENVKILIVDDKKMAVLKKEDVLFYHSLCFGSIIIYGAENEI